MRHSSSCTGDHDGPARADGDSCTSDFGLITQVQSHGRQSDSANTLWRKPTTAFFRWQNFSTTSCAPQSTYPGSRIQWQTRDLEHEAPRTLYSKHGLTCLHRGRRARCNLPSTISPRFGRVTPRIRSRAVYQLQIQSTLAPVVSALAAHGVITMVAVCRRPKQQEARIFCSL